MNGFDDTDISDAGDKSDVSSVFDVEAPPFHQLRTYTAVYPPQLPDYTFLDGQEYETRWIEDSWRYTARAYNEWDGSGFEVRQMDIAKFGDFELADPDDLDYWPPKYAMGPPTQDKEWHALIEKWGFPVLEKAGFLNYYPPAQDKDMEPIGRLADARNPQKEDKKRIHPVLKREMWRDIGDDEWQLLRPALLLASAMLDDPATLTFLYAITDTASTTEFVDTLHGKCKVAYIPAALTDIEQSAVYSKVLTMRNWLTWRFVPQRDMVAKDADGITNWRFDANGNCVGASDWLDLISEIRSRALIGRLRLQPRDFSRVLFDAYQLLPIQTFNTLTTTLLTTSC
jgi:hypothetical protein